MFKLLSISLRQNWNNKQQWTKVRKKSITSTMQA